MTGYWLITTTLAEPGHQLAALVIEFMFPRQADARGEGHPIQLEVAVGPAAGLA